MKLVFVFVVVVLLLFNNSSKAYAELSIREFSLLKKLRLLQGRPLGLNYCLCPSIYMPVCASDQQTYSNACAARCKTQVRNMQTKVTRQRQYTYTIKKLT